MAACAAVCPLPSFETRPSGAPQDEDAWFLTWSRQVTPSNSGGPAPRAKTRALRQRLPHHQHLADRRGRYQSDQASDHVHYADGRHGFLLQEPEGLFESMTSLDGRNVLDHDVG